MLKAVQLDRALVSHWPGCSSVAKRGANIWWKRISLPRLQQQRSTARSAFEAYLPAGIGNLAPGLANCLRTRVSIGPEVLLSSGARSRRCGEGVQAKRVTGRKLDGALTVDADNLPHGER